MQIKCEVMLNVIFQTFLFFFLADSAQSICNLESLRISKSEVGFDSSKLEKNK